MRRKLSRLIVLTTLTTIVCWSSCFSDNVSWEVYYVWDPEAVSWINLPWIVEYDWEWWNELLLIAKNLFARALEYLPMLVLVLLLFACIKIIFEWDWKAWFKRIKYILIWVALMILSIYVMNIISTIISGYPLINIHLNGLYY